MKTRTLLILFVITAVLVTACGGETANDNVDNQAPAAPVPDPEEQNTSGHEDQDVENENQSSEAQENQADEAGEEAPTEEPSADEAAAVSFADDVLPILQSRCLNCHGGDRTEGGLVMRSYAELMAGGEGGAVILPGDAAGSLLYELASTGEMPKRGANLTPVQLAVIEQWINEGALDN